MAAHASMVSTASSRPSTYTLTGLKRWSCQSNHLPPASQIQSIHVYDFDNTLFKSPLPNSKVWNAYTVSRLQNQDVFINGGWWHDPRLLEATGEGLDVEESRAWAGWWNEQIVDLVRLSMKQPDAIKVLLTGRAERRFSDLIKRMVSSKNLAFDLICLKPEVGPYNQRFASTMQYKQAFLQDLVYTYHAAHSIKIYEDRPKQTKGFRDFFSNLNQSSFPNSARKALKTDVVQVADQVTTLDPVVEVAEVQEMINQHNTQSQPLAAHLHIKSTVLHTSYLISPADTVKLLGLVKVPPNLIESEIKYLANCIMIVPRPADKTIMDKVGPVGSKQTWQVNGFAFYQSSIWAVRVTPWPSNSSVYTYSQTPLIVLATYKNTKPELANSIRAWQSVPTENHYLMHTEVGEKVQLRLDALPGGGSLENRSDRRGVKRRGSFGRPTQRNGLNGDAAGRTHQPVGHGKGSYQNRGKGLGRPGAVQSRSSKPNGQTSNHGRQYRQKAGKGGYRSLDELPTNSPRYGIQGRESDRNQQDGRGGALDKSQKPSAGLPYGS